MKGDGRERLEIRRQSLECGSEEWMEEEKNRETSVNVNEV
jgi:hypothetical protein